MKRKLTGKKKMPPLDYHFCTECNADLDAFDFSDNVNDIDAVKKNHMNCRHTGKFKGEMCSKIFIANIDDDVWEDDDEDDDLD